MLLQILQLNALTGSHARHVHDLSTTFSGAQAMPPVIDNPEA